MNIAHTLCFACLLRQPAGLAVYVVSRFVIFTRSRGIPKEGAGR